MVGSGKEGVESCGKALRAFNHRLQRRSADRLGASGCQESPASFSFIAFEQLTENPFIPRPLAGQYLCSDSGIERESLPSERGKP